MKQHSLDQQMQELHAAGFSIRGIASELGVNKSKVQRTLMKLSLPSPIKVDTLADTLHGTGSDTSDTLSDTPAGTAYRDTFSLPGTASGTVATTLKSPENVVKPILPVQKSFTTADLRKLLDQVCFFKQDYDRFVSKMVETHMGNQAVFCSEYADFANKARALDQLFQGIIFHAGGEREDFVVPQVLLSIQNTVKSIVSGKDRVNTEYGILYLTDRVRSRQFWTDSLDNSIFEPAIDLG